MSAHTGISDNYDVGATTLYTGSKRHCLHAVELSQRSGKLCANCVDHSRPPLITVFWASQPCRPAHKSG